MERRRAECGSVRLVEPMQMDMDTYALHHIMEYSHCSLEEAEKRLQEAIIKGAELTDEDMAEFEDCGPDEEWWAKDLAEIMALDEEESLAEDEEKDPQMDLVAMMWQKIFVEKTVSKSTTDQITKPLEDMSGEVADKRCEELILILKTSKTEEEILERARALDDIHT